MRTTVLFAVAAMAVGCTGEIGGQGGVQSWALEADEHGGLVDARHPEFGSYPNPRAVGSMLVTLHRNGAICATADGDAWCGGVLTGIPYRAAARVRDGQACVAVVDLYGNRTDELCGAAARIASDEGGGEAGCIDATASDGSDCRLCTDGAGEVTENTCTSDRGGDSTIDEFGEGDCTGGDAAVLEGARLYVDAVNEMLERAGLDVVMPEPDDVSALTSFDDGDLELGSAGCEDVLEYLDDEFDDDIGDGEDDVFGEEAMQECLEDGSCRIGQIVTRAMAEACRNIPPGCNVRQMSEGIVGAGGETVQELCDEGDDEDAEPASNKSAILQECVGSPLVLDLAGDGLALQGPDAGARFALFAGPASAVGWVAGGDDALLAVDLDGDGAIRSGLELFGEAGGARDGFAALARHDDNGDGVIDPSDAIYDRLLAWRDDGDGVSAQAELLPLAATGVVTLPIAGAPLGVVDRAGNELGLEATARAAGGRAVSVVDVWFRLGR